MTEAGWYHAQGDPVGTIRRWNGEAWIGFPIPDPNAGPAAASGMQTRLTQKSARLTVAVLALFTALAALFGYTALQMFNLAGLISDELDQSGEVLYGSPPIADSIDTTVVLSAGIAGLMLVTALVFIPWLRSVAHAAQIHRFRSPKRATRRPKRSTLAIVVQVLLFGLLAPIFWGLRALIADIARASGSNGGLLDLVQDTAMESSYDPRTQVSAISPVTIMVWWALWWLPIIAIGGIGIWAYATAADENYVAALRLCGIMYVLEVVSLACISVVATQIARHLQS